MPSTLRKGISTPYAHPGLSLLVIDQIIKNSKLLWNLRGNQVDHSILRQKDVSPPSRGIASEDKESKVQLLQK
jgi:hypothetical protein